MIRLWVLAIGAVLAVSVSAPVLGEDGGTSRRARKSGKW